MRKYFVGLSFIITLVITSCDDSSKDSIILGKWHLEKVYSVPENEETPKDLIIDNYFLFMNENKFEGKNALGIYKGTYTANLKDSVIIIDTNNQGKKLNIIKISDTNMILLAQQDGIKFYLSRKPSN